MFIRCPGRLGPLPHTRTGPCAPPSRSRSGNLFAYLGSGATRRVRVSECRGSFPLLESLGIRATFFITGFVAAIYPGLIERIARGGHEIAVHGLMHEWLQDRPIDEQVEMVRRGSKALQGHGPVTGANYIFRMDHRSPEALLRAGLRYFVLFRKALYHRTRFMNPSSRVRSLRTASGDLTLVPIGIETYAMSRLMVKAMIDTAWKTSVAETVRHLSLLMHPFMDGSMERMNTTEWVLRYLTEHLRLTSVPLEDVAHTEPQSSRAFQILLPMGTRMNRSSLPTGMMSGFSSLEWWAPIIYHSMRTRTSLRWPQ